MNKPFMDYIERKHIDTVELPRYIITHEAGWEIYDTRDVKVIIPDQPFQSRKDAEEHIKKLLLNPTPTNEN